MTSILPARSAPGRPGAVAGSVARASLRAALGRIHHGRLTIHERGRRSEFGREGDELHGRIEIHDRAAWPSVVRGGSVGLGLSYVDGSWDSDDLVSVIRLAARNIAVADRVPNFAHRLASPLLDLVTRRAGDRDVDRRNIRAHYDLGNEFFGLFLDPTMTYSAGVFESPDATLADASRAKLDRICRKLRLEPGDRVVEIGTGWGSFALHAARHYGCLVTTTTISDRQHDYASKAVVDAGLADRITVLNDDYRDLTGDYDALVSIEMIEAVNWDQYDTFFGTCANLLRRDGRMALQAIVIADQRFERSKRRNDFVKSVIFPGGCLPSIEALTRSATRSSDMRIVDLEDIGFHYAETLRRWRVEFDAHENDVRALGLDAAFVRMWRFYLAYCEASFLERQISDVQVVLTRPGWRPARTGLVRDSP